MKIVKHFMLVLLLLVTSQVTASGFEVARPWIREAPPGMKMLAGYMTLQNDNNGAVNFVGATSRDFGSIEIHQSVIKADIATMIRQQSVKIPPFSTVKFEPKGLHLMLINPKRELKQGDKVRIVLKFSNYRKLKIIFPVRKVKGGMHHN